MTEFEISKDEARRLIADHAWERREGDESTCGHRGCEDHPVTRTMIHGQTGFGSDWSLESALQTVEAAQSIYWVLSLLGHDLCVIREDGKPVTFDVRSPDEVRQRLINGVRAADRDSGASGTSGVTPK